MSLTLKPTVQEHQILCVAGLPQRPYGGGSGGIQHEASKPTFQNLQQQTPIVSCFRSLKHGHYSGNVCQSHLWLPFEDFPLKAFSVSSGEAQLRGDLSNLPLLGRNRWGPGGQPPPWSSSALYGGGGGVGRGMGWELCESPWMVPWGPDSCTFLELPLPPRLATKHHTVTRAPRDGESPRARSGDSNSLPL